MSKIDELSCLASPYSAITSDDEALFSAAMDEARGWHFQQNPTYRKLISSLPADSSIPIQIFKEMDLSTSVTRGGQWLSSSGTSQSGRTTVYFDDISMSRIHRAEWEIFAHHGMIGTKPSRFLLLSPNPEEVNQSETVSVGYATAFLKMTGCAPKLDVEFGVSPKRELLTEKIAFTLKSWSQEEIPVYILGLTAFFEQLVCHFDSPIEFKGPLKALTGGGWKGLTRKLSRGEIGEKFIQTFVGDSVDIRDLFGLTEHPLHYISCPRNHFHIPKYSRFSIVGPEGNELPLNQEGLLRLRNPFFDSIPSFDLLTSDLGMLGQDCSCGETLPYFKFSGRLNSLEGTCSYHATRL